MRKEKPEYLKLYEQLRAEITEGIRPYGSRLPSRRQLSQESGRSAVTVEHSLDLLCQEGYAEPRARSGFYGSYRAADVFSPAVPQTPGQHAGGTGSARTERPSAVPLPGGSEEEGITFYLLARAVRRVLAEQGETLLQRSEGRGIRPLREALAAYLGRNRGMRVTPDQIVVGAGAEYLYGLVVELLGDHRRFALEDPSYEKIEAVYRAKGVECEMLPLGPDGILSSALTASDAGVLHISPFRSFPSGVTASASKRGEYVRWAGSGDRYIVEDDFESEFSLLRKPEDTVFSLSREGRVIYLNTFSRTISPALRVGYMVLPEQLAARFRMTLGFYSCTVPVLEQYVLTYLLESGEFERHVNRIRRRNRRMTETAGEQQ